MRKNIIISLLLVIFSMAICFALAACNNKNGSGENSADSEKKYSEGLKYVLSDDKTFFYVCGIGSCSDADVFLPSTHEGKPVKGIWSQAFENCTNLASVTIGDNITSIGNYAFSGCSSLTNIVIPNNVTTIGGNSFQNCTNLTSVTIGNGVTSIYGYSFQNCTNLANVTIGDNVTSIEKYTFSGCSGLTNIVIPNNVTTISENAFENCTNLISVTIGNNVTSIESYAFYNCYKLVEVINKSSLNIISGDYANGKVGSYAKTVHNGDSKIVKKDNYIFITGDDGVNYLIEYIGNASDLILPESYDGEYYAINDYAFYKTDNLKSIKIPDCVTSIGEYSFRNCTNLANVTIGDNVTSIEKYTFSGCSGLTNIVIPNNVTTISENAFENCTNLISVTIGNNVTSIESYAFYNCYKLVEVINKSSLNIISGDYANGKVGSYAKTVHNGDSKIVKKDNYIFITGDDGVNYLIEYIGNASDLILPESYDGEYYAINGYAFYKTDNLKSIKIPNCVTSIGEYSFENCTNLASVTIGAGVTSIEDYAFVRCSSLASVTLINGEAEISDSAFYKCEAIKYNEDDYGYYLGCDTSPYLVFMKQKGSSCIINDGCVNILGSFNTSINTLKMPSGVKRINEDAFYYTTVITSAEIPAFAIKYLKKVKNVDDIIVTSGDIGNYAFSDMELKSVTIASNATYIGMYAFQNCFYLDTVYIPNSVTEIGKNIFHTSGWSVDPTIIYNGTMEQWKNIVKDKQWKGTNGIYGTSVSITIKCVDGTLIEE